MALSPWVFDAHSDIAGDLFLRDDPQRFREHIDRMIAARVGAVITCLWGFADPGVPAAAQQLRQLELLEQALAEVPRATLCLTPQELAFARRRHDVAFVLGIEGFEVPVALLPELHDRGMRHAMLRWSVDSPAVRSGHLTGLGKEVVREIERRHWLVDVSHLPEPAFWELLEETECPILASHSNAAALQRHERNLTDDQLRAVAERGGVVGLNSWPPFLSSDAATREDFIRHIRYVSDLIGPDHVAFGFDFVDYLLDVVDLGSKDLATGLAGLEDVPGLLADLVRHGFTEVETEHLAHGNLINLWQAVSALQLPRGGAVIG